MSSLKSGKLHTYNGPTTFLLGDKRNLAILSQLGSSDLFDAQEQSIIERHIPWTRRVITEETDFDGQTVTLPEFLLAEREKMVIKKSLSAGGSDVFIGRFTPPEEWKERVEAATASGDWVAQEEVRSLPFLYQNGDYGCSPHDVVWGPFVFGSTYGGTIVRAQPREWKGIVNLSRGATEGAIFELEES